MTSIAEAAASGDRIKALEAMRDKLAKDMDEAPAAVVAQINGQLRATLAELAELGAGKKASGLDELLARRSARIAAADKPVATPRKTRKRSS